MASDSDTARGTTSFPDFSHNYKESAGGTISLNRFVKIASDGDVEQGTFNAPVVGVLRSVYTNSQTAVASDKVSVGIGRVTCIADQAISAGQALKCAGSGRATQLVDSALAGTTIEDNVGLAFGNQPSNDGVEILSDSASDVQVATIYGTTTGTDTVVTETITLTGTVAVSTVKTDWGVLLGVKVASAAVGTITFREASGNATITTIAPAATQSGVITVTAGQEKAYNVAPVAVGSGATTKQIGLLGTDESDAVLTDSQALTGTVPVVMNDTFKTVTHLLVGDVESSVTVTAKVGAEDSIAFYAGVALEAAAAQGDKFDALVLPLAVTSGSLDVLESVTAGLVSPGKAVVVDSNKDIGDFRNLDAVNIDAGSSGTAGSYDVFPATAAMGKITLSAADSAGDTATTITNASQAGARTYTIPDAGASASFVMTEGAQTINGVKTFDNNGIKIEDSNASHGVTISPGDESADRVLSIPVLGGADTLMTLATAQTITGAKTFGTASLNTANVGTVETGTTAVEYGDGRNHVSVLTVSTTLPAIAGGAALAVGKLLYTMPAGACVIRSAKMSLAITQTQGNITADTPDGGLGSVIGVGAVATLDGTPTFEDILTGQTFNDCNGTAEVKTVAGQPMVMETGAAHTVHFNVADTWAASGDAAATLVGTVILDWVFLG